IAPALPGETERGQHDRPEAGLRDSSMNRFLFGVARAVTETFTLPEPVVEIGSYQVEGQDDGVHLRNLFGGRDFIGVDMGGGPRRPPRTVSEQDHRLARRRQTADQRLGGGVRPGRPAITPEQFARHRALVHKYAHAPEESLTRQWRYRLASLLCGRGPFASY